MSKVKSISYSFKCDQDFSNMSTTDRGAHCGQCNKDVIDLTTMSDDEIIRLLENIKESSTCARLTKNQLKDINRILANRSKSNFNKLIYPVAFSIILGLSSCGRPLFSMADPDNYVGKSSSMTIIEAYLLPPDSNTYVIRGKVLDDLGDGAAFANVYIPELKNGRKTDLDGNFNIILAKDTLPPLDSLSISISYVGMRTFESELKSVINKKVEIELARSRTNLHMGTLEIKKTKLWAWKSTLVNRQ